MECKCCRKKMRLQTILYRIRLLKDFYNFIRYCESSDRYLDWIIGDRNDSYRIELITIDRKKE
jgi:hypothetical protein